MTTILSLDPDTVEDPVPTPPGVPWRRAIKQPRLGHYRHNHEDFYYYRVPLMPPVVASNAQYGFLDGFAVPPPSRSWRPYVPTYDNLKPKTGIFVPRGAFIVAVGSWLAYSALAVALVMAVWVLFAHTWTALVILLMAVISTAGLISVVAIAYRVYLKWQCIGLTVTTEALYKFEAIYSRGHISVQGDDIADVKIDYPRPMSFWKYLGIGTLVIEFNGGTGTNTLEFNNVCNIEAVGSLVRGLQRAREQAEIGQADTMERMLEAMTEIRDGLSRRDSELLEPLMRLANHFAPIGDVPQQIEAPNHDIPTEEIPLIPPELTE